MKKKKLLIVLYLVFVVLALCLGQSGAEDIQNEFRADATMKFEEGKIILTYPEGQTDTLRGEQVESFLGKNPHLDGFLVSVYRVEIVAEKTDCTFHSILVSDKEHTRFMTISCGKYLPPCQHF